MGYTVQNTTFHEKDIWVLWEDDETGVIVPIKTSWPVHYGGWVIVVQNQNVKTPYDNYRLYAKMSVIAATVQKGLEEMGLAPHANIQSNANWAFRNRDGSLRDVEEGREKRKIHIHIFGRMFEDPSWADPILLPSHQEYNSSKKFWGKVWNKKDMDKLINFLEAEIPKAITELSSN
jgi:hypothetical protein